MAERGSAGNEAAGSNGRGATSEISDSGDSTPAGRIRELSLLVRSVSLPAWLGVVYLIGFLVVNGHLSQYGIYDLVFANVRYVVAGVLYVAFLLIFYLFAGRAVLFGPQWLKGEIELLTHVGAGRKWHMFAFLQSHLNSLFYICLSAGLFSSLAFRASDTYAFYAALGLGFFVIYTLDITNFDVRYPRTTNTIQFVVKILVVVAFFVLMTTEKPFIVFTTYFGMFFYVNMVLDRLERYRVTADALGFVLLYSVIFFLSTAIGFGSLIYGNVSHKIGGGAPVSVTVSLAEDYQGALDPSKDGTAGLDATLVYANDSHLFFQRGNKTIRLPESAVKWMTYDAPSMVAPVFGTKKNIAGAGAKRNN